MSDFNLPSAAAADGPGKQSKKNKAKREKAKAKKLMERSQLQHESDEFAVEQHDDYEPSELTCNYSNDAALGENSNELQSPVIDAPIKVVVDSVASVGGGETYGESRADASVDVDSPHVEESGPIEEHQLPWDEGIDQHQHQHHNQYQNEYQNQYQHPHVVDHEPVVESAGIVEQQAVYQEHHEIAEERLFDPVHVAETPVVQESLLENNVHHATADEPQTHSNPVTGASTVPGVVHEAVSEAFGAEEVTEDSAFAAPYPVETSVEAAPYHVESVSIEAAPQKEPEHAEQSSLPWKAEAASRASHDLPWETDQVHGNEQRQQEIPYSTHTSSHPECSQQEQDPEYSQPKQDFTSEAVPQIHGEAFLLPSQEYPEQSHLLWEEPKTSSSAQGKKDTTTYAAENSWTDQPPQTELPWDTQEQSTHSDLPWEQSVEPVTEASNENHAQNADHQLLWDTKEDTPPAINQRFEISQTIANEPIIELQNEIESMLVHTPSSVLGSLDLPKFEEKEDSQDNASPEEVEHPSEAQVQAFSLEPKFHSSMAGVEDISQNSAVINKTTGTNAVLTSANVPIIPTTLENSKLDSIFGEIEDEEDDFFSTLKQIKKQEVTDPVVPQKPAEQKKSLAEKSLSLAFFDDDDLLFDDEPEDPVASTPQVSLEPQVLVQTPVAKSKNLYIPSGPTIATGQRAPSYNAPINTAQQEFNKKLNESKLKNDAYDFPMQLVNDKVKPAARTKSTKYGPVAPTTGGQIPSQTGESVSRLTRISSTSSSASSTSIVKPGPPKSFFEELPIEMPKAAPRPLRMPKTNLLTSPMTHAQNHLSGHKPPPQQQASPKVLSKPNPYAPKASNLPPPVFNVRTGVVPPTPQQVVPGPSVVQPPHPMQQGNLPHPIHQGNLPPPMHQGNLPPPMHQGNLPPPMHHGNLAPPMQQGSAAPQVGSIPPPTILQPNQIPHMSIPSQPFPTSRKTSNPSPNTINTNVPKASGSGSATSPYVPKAGPYAPGNRKSHSRANSLVGGKGKENPYAPALPVANESMHILPGYVQPGFPPPPGNNFVPNSIGQQQFQHQHSNSLTLPPQGRGRGLSLNKSNIHNRTFQGSQIAPKVQNPTELLQRQFPIFSWSNSTNVACLIPSKETNIYGKSNNETISIKSVGKVLKFTEAISTFPGPFTKANSKTKKKEIEKWLEGNESKLSTDPKNSSDEILLNKVLSTLLQSNGDVTSKQFIDAICPILNPLVNYNSPPELGSVHTIATPTAYKLDNSGLNMLLNFLQIGKDEEAIEFCISKGDWAMALTVANASGKERFQKVSSDFARSSFPFQVSQSKVHHLLPIVLKAVNGASKSAIQDFVNVGTEGDWAAQHWRDIIASVYIHGSANSLNFCMEFGKYLRTRPGLEIASDICFILAGIPLTPTPLQNGVMFPIVAGDIFLSGLYTEIYEFALLFSSGQFNVAFPHLYPAKLKFAQLLADYGLFNESQKYCDHLGPLLKPSGGSGGSKSSRWYEFQQLALRLSSTSEQDQSWFGNRMSKVNLDNMWGQLDKFIVGDAAKPKTEGVFSKFSPSVSRNASTLDFTALNSNTYVTPSKDSRHSFQGNMSSDAALNFGASPLNYSAPSSADNTYPTRAPHLGRANTSASISRYSPANGNVGSTQSQHVPILQTPIVEEKQIRTNSIIPSQPYQASEGNSRYAPSNISSQSLLLNQQDATPRAAKEKLSPHIPHRNSVAESGFAYMNPGGELSSLSIGSYQPPTQTFNGVHFNHQSNYLPHQPQTSETSRQPPQQMSSPSRPQVLNKVLPSPHSTYPDNLSQTEQQIDTQQFVDQVQPTIPQFNNPRKRSSVGSVTTENFGNPDAIRAQNHSPSAPSDISLDYEYKSDERKFDDFGIVDGSPEKKVESAITGSAEFEKGIETVVRPADLTEESELSPPISSAANTVVAPASSGSQHTHQYSISTIVSEVTVLEEVVEKLDADAVNASANIPTPPPPVLKAASNRTPASITKRPNPYAPGGTSRNMSSSSRKNRYGPPAGTPKTEFVAPIPQGEMYNFGGYNESSTVGLESKKESTIDENAESHSEQSVLKPTEQVLAASHPPAHEAKAPVIKNYNVDISFEEEPNFTPVSGTSLPGPPPPPLESNNLINSSPMKTPSMFNPYQGDISSPNVGFGDFPVPGTPDYTTRANSVIGGQGGYFSSRLSQSHKSAMYQQYEVQDDTVKDFVPVLEEEDEEDEDLATKERETREHEAIKAAKAAADLKVKHKEDEQRRNEQSEAEKKNDKDNDSTGLGGRWFGNWLGRIDDGKPKAIRAKLGEKSSFYYDEKLKKWINKDLPIEEQLKPSGPPPPPKMKKPNSSPVGPPGPGPGAPPIGTNPMAPPMGSPTAANGLPLLTPGGAPGAPSRSTTSSAPPARNNLATAGLDDLLSIGTPSVGSGTRKTKRGPKRGYVNVLNQDN